MEALEKGVHVWGLRFSFDGKSLYWQGRIPFVYPDSREALFLMEALREAARIYNERFSPEARAELTSLWLYRAYRFNVLFSGYLCLSCGLYDYFYDFSEIAKEVGIKSKPESYTKLGNVFLARYSVENILG